MHQRYVQNELVGGTQRPIRCRMLCHESDIFLVRNARHKHRLRMDNQAALLQDERLLPEEGNRP